MKLRLLLLLLLLFANILPDGGLVVPYRTDAMASGPKMQASHPVLVQQLTMDSDSTFACQKSYRVGNTLFGGNTQTQMNVIRQCLSVEQLDLLLLTQLPKYAAYFLAHRTAKHVLPILRDTYNVELTVPCDM